VTQKGDTGAVVSRAESGAIYNGYRGTAQIGEGGWRDTSARNLTDSSRGKRMQAGQLFCLSHTTGYNALNSRSIQFGTFGAEVTTRPN
jgi:hypothetical protein